MTTEITTAFRPLVSVPRTEVIITSNSDLQSRDCNASYSCSNYTSFEISSQSDAPNCNTQQSCDLNASCLMSKYPVSLPSDNNDLSVVLMLFYENQNRLQNIERELKNEIDCLRAEFQRKLEVKKDKHKKDLEQMKEDCFRKLEYGKTVDRIEQINLEDGNMPNLVPEDFDPNHMLLKLMTAANIRPAYNELDPIELHSFNEKEGDIDTFIRQFERIAYIQKFDKSEWAIRLASLLTGKAAEAYIQMPFEDANDFKKVKKVLLQRYQLSDETYRLKFRESKKEENETYSQFVHRMKTYFDRWAELSTNPDLKDLLLQEQFYSNCSTDLEVFVCQNSPTDITNVAEIADRYDQAFEVYENRMKCDLLESTSDYQIENDIDTHTSFDEDIGQYENEYDCMIEEEVSTEVQQNDTIKKSCQSFLGANEHNDNHGNIQLQTCYLFREEQEQK